MKVDWPLGTPTIFFLLIADICYKLKTHLAREYERKRAKTAGFKEEPGYPGPATQLNSDLADNGVELFKERPSGCPKGFNIRRNRHR